MKKLANLTIIYLILIGLMAATMGYAITFEYFEAKLLPIMVAGIIILLAAIGIKTEKSPWEKPEETRQDFESIKLSGSDTGLRGYVNAAGWCLGFALVIYLLGFIIAIPLFIFLYLKAHKTGWITSTVYAVIMLVLTYAIFELGLKIILYRGLVFSAI